MIIYRCNICKNIITMLDDKGPVPSCCGQPMSLMMAKTTDEYSEKHVPVIECCDSGSKGSDGNCADTKCSAYNCTDVKVTVGSVLHPMSDDHKIDWIGLETNKGFHVMYLKTDADPVANFKLDHDEKIEAAYAYCNVHGLWKGECL